MEEKGQSEVGRRSIRDTSSLTTIKRSIFQLCTMYKGREKEREKSKIYLRLDSSSSGETAGSDR